MLDDVIIRNRSSMSYFNQAFFINYYIMWNMITLYDSFIKGFNFLHLQFNNDYKKINKDYFGIGLKSFNSF